MPDTHPIITLTDAPEDRQIKAIADPLTRFNELRAGRPNHYRPLLLSLTHPDTAEPLGGLWGWTSFSVLFIDLLFIPGSHRGLGLGTCLLAQAEQEAILRGCHTAWLDPFSFQAPDFYPRHGYVVFGSIPHYPPGHTRFFLKKGLQPLSSSS